MGGGYSLPADVHVVVVGGGFAGVALAHQLMAASAEFTLIDPKDVFHQNLASVRSCVEEGWAHKTLIPYKPTFGNHHRKGRVVSIDAKKKVVTLETGNTIAYDALVISTGSKGPFPFKLGYEDTEQIVADNKYLLQQVREARRVAVVGGGACGVEVAGEIATDFPEKRVTVVHPSHVLCSAAPTGRFQTRLRQILDQLGVHLLLGERVMNLHEIETNKAGRWVLSTDRGSQIEADLVLKCTGTTINTDAFRDTLGECMDERDALRVNTHLQVEGHQQVFAIGDCNNVAEPKMAALAGLQGKHVMAQLHNMYHGQPLTPYKPDNKPHAMVLSVGRNEGLGQLKNGYMIPEFVIRYLRSDIFLSKFWQEFKQTMPE